MLAVAEPIPLQEDADQVIRVGGTRVPLETVIETFEAGATPEEIAQDFPVLRLDDVYAVITYYLRHRQESQAYLEKRRAAAEEVRKQVEAMPSHAAFRERLLRQLGR